MWHYQLFSSWGENHQGAQLERLTVGIVISIFQGNYSRFWHGLGRVWDSVCGAFPQKTQKNPSKHFASNALILAACEGETRDLNWAAKNRRSELAAALRLFRSRLSPTQSQTGPYLKCCPQLILCATFYKAQCFSWSLR